MASFFSSFITIETTQNSHQGVKYLLLAGGNWWLSRQHESPLLSAVLTASISKVWKPNMTFAFVRLCHNEVQPAAAGPRPSAALLLYWWRGDLGCTSPSWLIESDSLWDSDQCLPLMVQRCDRNFSADLRWLGQTFLLLNCGYKTSPHNSRTQKDWFPENHDIFTTVSADFHTTVILFYWDGRNSKMGFNCCSHDR